MGIQKETWLPCDLFNLEEEKAIKAFDGFERDTSFLLVTRAEKRLLGGEKRFAGGSFFAPRFPGMICFRPAHVCERICFRPQRWGHTKR